MVTKKRITTKVATKASVLKFNPDWVKDEVPPWVRLDRAAIRDINQAKKDFSKRVSEILAKAQR
jgi:hypothetical protein